MLLALTPSATKKVRELLDNEQLSSTVGLRVRVIAGGCSGLRYELLFDTPVDGQDLAVEQDDIMVVVDEKSAPYLEGVQIDYFDGLNESGFKITNPNAISTCGCGESFGT